ncbi:MAG: hypothetical protein KA764_09385 [Anaerolineales bacterium]|nr:hypothetical protein [Anaerolineales bacterium]
MTGFQLVGAGAGAPDVLGLWALPADEVSFAVGAEPAASLWQIDLAGAPEQAAQQLEAGLRQVAAAEGALDTARQRLDQLAAANDGVSFAVGAETRPPEQAALAALEHLRVRAAGEISFAAPGEAAAAEREFAGVLRRLTDAVRYFAVVETRLGGQLAARTSIAWSADADTLWPASTLAAGPLAAGPLAAGTLALHARSLRLALASRAALLRILLVTAQGAVRLAGTLALPGGALLALPVAWKFINQVLAEAGRYRDAQASL